MVDWKKEFHPFGDKEKGAKHPDDDAPSIWKRDVSLGRKKPDGVPPTDEHAAEPTVPWYKKDVSLGRKQQPEPPAEIAEPVEAEPAEPAVPWYKKELSLGRKQQPEQLSESPPEVEPVPRRRSTDVEAEAPTPWYKKELSLGGRKGQEEPRELSPPLPVVSQHRRRATDLPSAEPVAETPEPTVVEPEPALVPEAVAPEPVVAAPEPIALVPDPEPLTLVPDIEPIALVPDPEPAPEPEPEPEPAALAPEPVPVPEPEGPAVSWVDAVLEGREYPAEPELEPAAAEPQPEAPAPVLPEPVAEIPAPVLPEPVADVAPPALPEPVAEVAPPPAPAYVPPPLEHVAAAFAAPPEPPAPPPLPPAAVSEPESEPRPVHPPVYAHELPPLPDGDEGDARPWYKRELSFKRGPKKPRAEPAARELPPLDEELDARPWYKRELALKRGSKHDRPARKPAGEIAAEAVVPEAPAKVPFWKLDLSRGRGAKAPKPAPEARSGNGADGGAPKKAMTAEKFWKRGLSLPTLTLPSFSGGGGGSRSGSVPKQLVGLKVGASQLAAARVSNNGHAEVLQVAREALDSGIVVGGELRDPDALADALKAFFAHNKLPKRGVRLGIANNRIGVRTFDIVGIHDPKQLANAIRFRAQEALPIPIEEAVLDYQVLEESVNEEGETVRKILLVVAYRELVDRYLAACKKAGIQLVGIDLEAFALLRSLAAPPEEGVQNTAALVAVAVGHDRSTFAVSDGRVCEFTRVLEWGGQNLSVAIARTLDLTPSEAEPIKRRLSLDPGPAPDGLTEEQFAAVKEAVGRQVQTFARELVSSLQFYQSQPGSLGIGEIILTGGTAHLTGFAAELQRIIGVRVRVGDPLVRVKVSKKMREPEQLGSLAVAIGLGIED